MGQKLMFCKVLFLFTGSLYSIMLALSSVIANVYILLTYIRKNAYFTYKNKAIDKSIALCYAVYTDIVIYNVV